MINIFGGWFSSVMKLIKFIGDSFKTVEHGTLHLAHGSHIVMVPLCINPKCAFVSFECDNRCHQVCGGHDINKVGYCFGCKEIIFYVDVKTNTATLKWFATE